MNKNLKAILITALVLIIYVLVSYLVKINLDLFTNYLDLGIIGILIYFLIAVIATVVAPINMVPLVAVAVAIWDWKLAAIITLLGWTLGAVISFLIGRHLGIKFLKVFIDTKKINEYRNFIPEKNIFFSIILIRIFLPIDFLSYALGIFTKVDIYRFTLATFIGTLPFAFTMAYLGSLPLSYQIISLVLGLTLLSIFYFKFKNNLSDKLLKKD
jgi:uncharacterized membrane protein YdjX (TVP38/TMEM64 family)